MDKPKPMRRVYMPIQFGAGIQPGTVESELIQRQERRAERAAKKWDEIRRRDSRLPIVPHPLLHPWLVLIRWVANLWRR
jgi:hypothetical protein